jgi:hypothetical protein
LALIQEANSIDVDNVNFVQVQSRRLSELLDFDPQIAEVRTSKRTGQTNSSPLILTKPFDPQRHCWHTKPICGRCKEKTIQKALSAKELAPARISGFRNFAFDRKNAGGIANFSQRRQHQPA